MVRRINVNGATKKPRKAKNSRLLKNVELFKAFGTSPKYTEKSTTSDYFAALNWANAALEPPQLKDELIFYAKQNLSLTEKELKKIQSSNSFEIRTAGKTAYLANNGWKLEPHSIEFIKNKIKLILNSDSDVELTVDGEEPKAELIETKQFKSDIALVKGYELKSDIEDLVFSFEYTNDKLNELIKNSKPKTLEVATAGIRDLFGEMKLFGKDDQITEGYAWLKKKQVKEIITNLEGIINSLSNQKMNIKVNKIKKPRAKKIKSAGQQIIKLKYKQNDARFNIQSVSPMDIPNGQKLIVFNAKTKKIGIYHAASIEGFQVKGSSLLNYNTELSLQKTLRETKKKSIVDTLMEFRKTTNKQADKLFDDLKGTPIKLKPRFNDEIIILKAFK